MKGIAIPYIIAIILGIAVVVVIGAVFFNTSRGVTEQECQNKLATFCTVWRITGSEPGGGWKQFSTACFNLGVGSDISKEGCINLLGRTVTTTATATATRATATESTATTDRTGKAGGPCNRVGGCDSPDLQCVSNICVTK